MQDNKSMQESTERKPLMETKKFQICDHLFRSYLECIHTFSVEKKDCIQICDTLEKIDLCRITVKIDK